jgi:hypothetical protein
VARCRAYLSKLSTGRVFAGVMTAAAGSSTVSRGLVGCGVPARVGLLPRLSVRLRLLRAKPGAALRGGVGVPGDGTPDDGERPAGPPAAVATLALLVGLEE